MATYISCHHKFTNVRCFFHGVLDKLVAKLIDLDFKHLELLRTIISDEFNVYETSLCVEMFPRFMHHVHQQLGNDDVLSQHLQMAIVSTIEDMWGSYNKEMELNGLLAEMSTTYKCKTKFRDDIDAGRDAIVNNNDSTDRNKTTYDKINLPILKEYKQHKRAIQKEGKKVYGDRKKFFNSRRFQLMKLLYYSVTGGGILWYEEDKKKIIKEKRVLTHERWQQFMFGVLGNLSRKRPKEINRVKPPRAVPPMVVAVGSHANWEEKEEEESKEDEEHDQQAQRIGENMSISMTSSFNSLLRSTVKTFTVSKNSSSTLTSKSFKSIFKLNSFPRLQMDKSVDSDRSIDSDLSPIMDEDMPSSEFNIEDMAMEDLRFSPLGLEPGLLIIPEFQTTINNSTYDGNLNISRLCIHDKVTRIGCRAFYNCRNLSNVKFGVCSKLKSINQHAFSRCTGLTTIEIPASVANIDGEAFSMCGSLKHIFFFDSSILNPSILKSIGPFAFHQCSALEKVVLPASLRRIHYGAFEGCIELKEIGLERRSRLEMIHSGAFKNCPRLKYVRIPSSVVEIELGAFDPDCILELENVQRHPIIFAKNRITLPYKIGRNGCTY